MSLKAKGLGSNLEVGKIDSSAEASLGPLTRKATPLLRLDVPLQRLGNPLCVSGSGGTDRKDRLGNKKVQLRVRGPSLKPLGGGLVTMDLTQLETLLIVRVACAFLASSNGIEGGGGWSSHPSAMKTPAIAMKTPAIASKHKGGTA